MDLKKTLIISLIAIIVVFTGILIFFLLRQEAVQDPPTSNNIPGFPSFSGGTTSTEPPPQILDAPGNKVSRIGDFAVFAPSISPDGKRVRFFERNTGNLYEANFNGTELTRVSSSLLPQGLTSVIWSPTKTHFGAFFESAPNNFLYDFVSGLSTNISKTIAGAAFAPQSPRIAYQDMQENESIITIATLTNTNQRVIFRGALPKTNFQWIQETRLSIVPFASGLIPGFVLTINPTSGAINQVIRDSHGLTALWSPNGKQFIYTKTDAFGHNLSLWLADENGNDIKKLDIITLAEKCVWAKDNFVLFCSAPETWPSDALLPDDYYKGIVRGADMFLRVNTTTNAVSFVLEPTLVDATNLIIAPQEDYLFFINRYDGGLYSIKL